MHGRVVAEKATETVSVGKTSATNENLSLARELHPLPPMHTTNQEAIIVENASALETPLRVGVFPNMEAADCAVQRLLQSGFDKEQISVLCSDAMTEAHYRRFEHQDPAGTNTAAAAVTGGAIGAVLGGLAVIAGAVTTGGLGLLAAGGIAAWSGGVVGGLVGAMMTRGVEKELANYYDQAVQRGKILVAAEDHSEAQRQMLAKAAKILAECGAEPVSLPEG